MFGYFYIIQCFQDVNQIPVISEWVVPLDEYGVQDGPEEPNQDYTSSRNGLAFDHDVYQSPDDNHHQAWFDFVYG